MVAAAAVNQHVGDGVQKVTPFGAGHQGQVFGQAAAFVQKAEKAVDGVFLKQAGKDWFGQVAAMLQDMQERGVKKAVARWRPGYGKGMAAAQKALDYGGAVALGAVKGEAGGGFDHAAVGADAQDSAGACGAAAEWLVGHGDDALFAVQQAVILF